MSEPNNCQVRARGIDVQCLKDEKTHIFAPTAEERLHEGIWRGHQVHWGSPDDIEVVLGTPLPKTECD